MSDTKIKVLAVDDNIVNIKVLGQYLLKQGYAVITAQSGEESIEKFKSESPDIILMDIMMSGMNGLEATAKIKALAGDNWVPVIFMSALASEEDKIKGLDIGGDDYITKPIEFNILGAKLKAVQRISDIQHKLSATMVELKQYKKAEEREQEMAYDLMESLFNTGQHLAGKDFHIWHIPATLFSGDLIVANKSSENRLYILHADSTGHGLTAALPLIPVSQTFYQMANKGFSIGNIAKEMNKQLKFIMPINRFVALTLLLVDMESNIIEIWNGGNPPVFITNEKKELVKQFDSRHLALGILPDESFDAKTEFFCCEGNNSVVMYSDGLTEAENSDGQIFNESMLLEILKTEVNAVNLRNNIVDAVSEHLDGGKAHDDMSLIVLNTQAAIHDA
ncbi:MAG: fused response regulator/phosphatase [Gammaproteobacteria bacterium]|nr:fused response regulator/phosphatase [Gammaproteobacteria bacterium]MCW8988514.1 fused response regulator/phosphatase [Gammaproteobacteria bacterium]MCW9032279.1 fused response regulator/phosphatase [Gammaproteobacteria bacterium]